MTYVIEGVRYWDDLRTGDTRREEAPDEPDSEPEVTLTGTTRVFRDPDHYYAQRAGRFEVPEYLKAAIAERSKRNRPSRRFDGFSDARVREPTQRVRGSRRINIDAREVAQALPSGMTLAESGYYPSVNYGRQPPRRRRRRRSYR